MDNENQNTTGDRPMKTFAEPSGSVTDTELFRSAEKLHLYISVMLKDWKDGDFALPRLAEIHMEQIREGYRALGKALNAELSRPAAHRVLKYGEIIERGDEVLGNGVWRMTTMSGHLVRQEDAGRYRRPESQNDKPSGRSETN